MNDYHPLGIGLLLLLPVACVSTDRTELVHVEEWTVVDTLFAPIGALDAPETHALFRARDARYLGSGLLAVVNADEEIRLFRINGEFVRSIGRRGDGPEEFGSLYRLSRLPDRSLLAIDSRRWRVLRFDTLGGFLGAFRHHREKPVEIQNGYAVPATGRIMVVGHSLPREPLPDHQTLIRPEVPVFIFDSVGDATRVDRILGQPLFVDAFGWRGQPLGPSTMISTWKDGAVISLGSEADLRLYDTRGSLVRILTSPRVPLPVTDETIARWEEERRKRDRSLGIPPEQPFWPRDWDLIFPDRLPVYDQVLADDSGCIWVRRFRPPGEDQNQFDVIDPASEAVATFSLRQSVRITDINDQLVVGIETDELGVQRIMLFEVSSRPDTSRLRCHAD